MIRDEAVRTGLAELTGIAAALVRTGREKDRVVGMSVVAHVRTIRQALCDHAEGYRSHVTMSGVIECCQGCGASS